MVNLLILPLWYEIVKREEKMNENERKERERGEER
jgi:hypothetical protein